MKVIRFICYQKSKFLNYLKLYLYLPNCDIINFVFIKKSNLINFYLSIIYKTEKLFHFQNIIAYL